MKTLLSLAIILVGFTVSAQIPNASFENWHPYPSGEFPDFWTTSDSVAVALGGGTSVFKGTDPQDGVQSIHLKSVNTTFGVKGPGIATNGIVTLSGSTFIFSGGTADTARYRFFTGWYKYAPTNGTDAAVIKAYLLRDNSGNQDTIADAVAEIGGTTSTYSQFILPFQFRDFVLQPDKFLIILQSSRGLNDANLGVGSEFIVDSINFSGFVGVAEMQSEIKSVKIFPLPASDVINIEAELKSNISIGYMIYDINGKLVRSAEMISTKEKIDVSTLSPGKYILTLTDGKKNRLYDSPVTIVR